jgi:hypothetical protein
MFNTKKNKSMKKQFLKLSTVLLIASVIFTVGCSNDNNGSGSVPDPAGTVIVSMRNANSGTTYVSPFESSYAYGFIIDRGDNFTGDYTSYWDFATIGSVSGLGNVTKIPTSGWAAQAAVIPGYGYVGRFKRYNSQTRQYEPSGEYIRIYVVEQILAAGTTGVIGAVIKYQAPFVPAQ